jgi:hypothetical protein
MCAFCHFYMNCSRVIRNLQAFRKPNIAYDQTIAIFAQDI